MESGDYVKIIVDGKPVLTKEYPEPIINVVTDPHINMIPEGSKWNTITLEEYSDQLLDADPRGFAYTYGERLREYRPHSYTIGCDQVAEIIEKLRSDRHTRQAVACTWMPHEDNDQDYPPCMLVIDAKIRKNKLNLTTFFRSNDMFSAWPQNSYGLTKLQSYLCRALHATNGKLVFISSSAHIYEYDFQDACKLTGLDYQVVLEEIKRI
jgi:thymidylate synthase